MQYIPGSSVTLSASLHYLAKNFPLPDDSDVQTRIPQICVDYLSHEWLEEDVWKSWRNMTRHKNEVANGVRLENASWRTWWKQRNKLKTVSPETLNWLKDSDVTWLYGPLHTAAEPVPKPKQSTYVDRYNLEKASGKKPILKHRTISELLNIHPGEQNAAVAQPSAGSPALEAVSMDFAVDDIESTGSPRPTLPHARSDSVIARRCNSVPLPPSALDNARHARLETESPPPHSASPSTQSEGTGNSNDLGSHLTLSPSGVRKHISFNTFVEQCISIDDPSSSARPSQTTETTSSSDDEGGEDEDEEEEEEDASSSTSSLLEMRPTSVVGSRPTERGPILRSNSVSQEREHMTIAPIPPTLLKASEELPAPSPAVVYAPPHGFDWDLQATNDFSSSSASSSADNLSSASGSSSVPDMGFVVPQWGRAPSSTTVVPPPVVGTGVTGSVGPASITEENVYATANYQEQQRRYHQALQEDAAKQKSGSSGGSGVIGMHAGRSKWVSGDAIVDEDEADEVSESNSEDDDEAGDDSEASIEDGQATVGRGAPGPDFGVGDEYSSKNPASVISRSTGSSSTTSASRTIVGAAATSPPTNSRPSLGRSTSQPGKGILKNSASGGAAVTIGASMDDGSTALHSVPIVIPKTSVSHPQPPASAPSTNPFGAGNGPSSSYFHMPPTATMTSPPITAPLPASVPNPSIIGSAGFLSPSQADALFSAVPPSGGRGRTATRSASSSGVSDRSRSSSKVSGGTSSPLGSVSPSGYGSPSGSRASSVLGNKRSSTDVGVAGRSVAVAAGVVSAGGRNGMASARQSSISPPSVSSPLASGGLCTLPTSNLGTIVANVPLHIGSLPDVRAASGSSSSGGAKGGPPLSRSGIASSRSGGSGTSSKPRLGRTGSGSSISSSGSSGSIGTASGAGHSSTTRQPSAAQVAAAAPSTGAASLPLHAKKPSVGLLLPNGEPRPTVIISPKTPTGPSAAQAAGPESSASSAVPSPSGGLDTREARLDEEMHKMKAAQTIVKKTPPTPSDLYSPRSDPNEIDTGTFLEHNLGNPTPSNSPTTTFSSRSFSSANSTATPSTPTKSTTSKAATTTSPKSKSKPSDAVVTQSSVSAPTLTSQPVGGDHTIVGKAADSIVSSAKGLLGAIWGSSGDGQGVAGANKS